MNPTDLQGFTWSIARIGGFTAYGLMLASVLIGLVLSLKWKSVRYPRFVTNEVHRFVTLLALVFTVVHGIAIAVDPFIKVSLPEILIPFTSHYRPAWMAFGIVAGYLLLAVYLSERIRSRIGYDWWRRFHTLAFVVYVFATIHGLGTGSDARTPWAIALYAGGAIAVGWPAPLPAVADGGRRSAPARAPRHVPRPRRRGRRLGRDRTTGARLGGGRGQRPDPVAGRVGGAHRGPPRPRTWRGSPCRSRPSSRARPIRPRRTAERSSSMRR